MSARSRSFLRFSALAVVSVGLLFAPGAAQAATTPLTWGCGGPFGPCATPGGLTDLIAADVLTLHSLALKADGTVTAWGCAGYDFGQCSVPGGLAGVTAIAAGDAHSLALRIDGTVVSWGCMGAANSGQCSVPIGLSGVTAISAGIYHSLAVKSDGTVVPWGCGFNYGQCNVPMGLSGVTAIAAGYAHSLALKSDGTVVAWGCVIPFAYGQCSVPGGLAGVTAISAGHAHNLALKGDGTVVSWGCAGADFGQCSVPGGLAGVTAISAGRFHSLALKSDGTVVAWGCVGADSGQCSVPIGLSGVTAISAGQSHSLALAELMNQTISFAPIADRTFRDPDFIVSATASSGLPVSFSASGTCSLSRAIVRVTGAGSCTVTASQSGGLNFYPAPAVSRTFAIAKAGQTVTFGPLANKTYGARDFRVSATASSGLPVSFAARGRCTVRGATVHLTGAGSCTVTAAQPGDANYNAAPGVSRTFSIARAPCTVPKVVGKRVAFAKRTIAQRHCRTGKVGYAYSHKRKKGIVISQSRRPGRVLPARSKINLIVSRGRRR